MVSVSKLLYLSEVSSEGVMASTKQPTIRISDKKMGWEDANTALTFNQKRISASLLTLALVILIPAGENTPLAGTIAAYARANIRVSSVFPGLARSNAIFEPLIQGCAYTNEDTAQVNGAHANSNGALTSSNGPHANANGASTSSNGPLANANGAPSSSNGPHANANGSLTTSNGPLANANGAPSSSNGPHANSNGAHGCDYRVSKKPYIRVTKKNVNKLRPKIYQFDKEKKNGIIWIRYLIFY